MNYYKISVITPSYNQGNFIEDTILSVLNQNYPDFEHIIMDGGSTDKTIEVIKKYSHIIWKSEKDRGQTHALNKALRLSTGDIICWLNSDDLVCENALHTVNHFFVNNPDKYCVIGNLLHIDESGNFLSEYSSCPVDYDGLLNKGQCVQQMSTFFRREVFDKIGEFDESYHYTMDHEFWVRVAKEFIFYTIDYDLAKFRRYSLSKTGSSELKFVKDLLRIKMKYRAKLISKDNIRLIMMYIKEPFKRISYLRQVVRRIKGKNPDFIHYS